MANTYCTATNWGKDFFTHEDRNDFYLSGHPGDVWVVGNNAAGVSWINRVTGTGKTKAEAQAIVDGVIETAQADWDALPEAEKSPAQEHITRPVKYTLPQELTMAEYRTIKGFKVQSLASDPSGPEGQVWYNTTGAVLKYQGVAAGAWASGGALNTGRALGGGIGTQTAAICVAGNAPPARNLTESYNGTAWTVENTCLEGRKALGGAFGTQTAGIKAGGTPPITDEAESWDGTSWTSIGNLQTAIADSNSGTGVSTAGIIACGYVGGDLATSQTWDGTSWAAANSANTARSSVVSGGITKDTALIAGGNLVPRALTETYDGTSWSEVADLTTGRANIGGGGPSTGTLGFGGTPPTTDKTELWDGTSWTEVADMTTAYWDVMGGSNSPATTNIAFGGDPGSVTTTLEWNGAPLTVKTVTVS